MVRQQAPTKKILKKAALIFSGYNQRSVVSYLRTLESKNITYAIIASSKSDPLFLTIYKRKILAVRKRGELDLNDILDTITTVKEKLQYDRYVIAPSTEALNRFLLEYSYEFELIGCEIPLVDGDLYVAISDKYKFNDLCKKHNILTPYEYRHINDVKLPCVAKPKRYYTDSGATLNPILIFTGQQLEEFSGMYNVHDFYLQEYVGGESLYLLYYFYKDGTVIKYSQKNLIQQPEGKSIVAAVGSDFHETSESLKYENLFKSVGFYGLAMVEVKHFNGNNYMIEANPRFWGPAQLFVDAGINLFEDFLIEIELMNKQQKSKLTNKKAKYFWYEGMMESLNSGRKLSYHDFKIDEFIKELPEWLASDVYNRDDTKDIFNLEINMTPKDRLVELYSNKSKHSNYQEIPSGLRKVLRDEDVQIKTRSDTERLSYVLEKINIKNKSVLDIGANTGFFTFELLNAGARMVNCYEGNKDHTEFIKLAANLMRQENNLKINSNYFTFDRDYNEHYDVTLILNVLHHVGDDYGNKTDSASKAKEIILEQLNSLAKITDTLVFQMGFNWKGNTRLPLFSNGTKKEMIDYIRRGAEGIWSVEAIGIPEKRGSEIIYTDLSENNIERDDSLGEFLNRPLFILRSRQ